MRLCITHYVIPAHIQSFFFSLQLFFLSSPLLLTFNSQVHSILEYLCSSPSGSLEGWSEGGGGQTQRKSCQIYSLGEWQTSAYVFVYFIQFNVFFLFERYHLMYSRIMNLISSLSTLETWLYSSSIPLDEKWFDAVFSTWEIVLKRGERRRNLLLDSR